MQIKCVRGRKKMFFQSITATCRSISLELASTTCVYAPFHYDVYIDGVLVQENRTKNIVNFYKLQPSTTYIIGIQRKDTLEQWEEKITTEKETVRLNIKKFGAKGDGKHLDSIHIQCAIAACPQDGTVYIPKGTYLCAPLFLKSEITLEFEEGAALIGHTNPDYYPILPGVTLKTDEKEEIYLGTWEGNPLDCFASLVTGICVKNVRIIGKGVLNGMGKEGQWWVNTQEKKRAWRPRTLFLEKCENIIVHGMNIKNSPSWTVHPYFSQHLKFIDMYIENPKGSPNTDGLNPESCNYVDILGVHFSVGDDCIAIKSGKRYMGRLFKTPSRNITIRNCCMEHGHGAVVIGSEMSGGVHNIVVEQCVFEKTDRGLRIKTRRGRGAEGRIDHIVFKNIEMNHVLTPFVMNMFYFCDPDGKTPYVWSKEKMPVTEETPFLGQFIFENIQCKNAHIAAAFFAGLPEQPIEFVRLANVSVHFSDVAETGIPAMMSNLEPMTRQGIIGKYITKLEVNQVHIEGYVGEKYAWEQVQHIVE